MLARLVHEPQRAPAHLQALLARLAEEAEVAVVALLDRGLQGAPAAEGLWRGLGLGLWRGLGHGPLGLACLALAALVVAVLAELFARRPADGRAHRGDVAQQEVEVAPVVKDHWDGLGRLGRDVAGVAQRPEILPGAVAVVELLLGGLEGREALPAVSGGPVLQLLPPGHADGPSSASPGEVVVGQLEKVVQHGADCVVLVAVPLVVREPQPQLLGRHVAAAADRDVAGRGRDGLARWLLLRYVDRRGGRAVDLEVRVARQGRELCGGLAPVAQQALLGPGQRHFPSALGYLSIALGGAVALPRGLHGEVGHAPRALVLHAAAGVGGRGSQGQPPPADQRLEVVDQAVVAAVQEKQHGVPDDARAARGALLEDVVVLQSVRPQGLLPHEDEDLHPPGVAELEGLYVVEVRRSARA